MAQGRLRIYLGAAPGVGKTYAMLEEAHRRRGRGTDVVVGFVEPHGRLQTTRLLEGLEVVPRAIVSGPGELGPGDLGPGELGPGELGPAATVTEMDVDAVLARRPQVAVVDELAHTNAAGSRNAKRWRDIQELLDAGITVLSTVNIEHLESLNDVVAQITGVVQPETVPDRFVRLADQVELVDMTPEALRRRMAHGNVYQQERIDPALSNYFRVGNLTALRELALLWLADKVDEQLDRYRAAHHIGATWEARERVVVALTGGPEGDTLIRRAARIAARTKGADLLAVHVARSDGLADADPALLARQRVLVESLGGTYHQVTGADIPRALLDFARGVNATQLVLGASRRGRFAQIVSTGVGVTTTALSGPIDVHLVTHEEIGRKRRWGAASSSPLSPRRRLAAFALALLGLPLLMLGLHFVGAGPSFASDLLFMLAAVVAVALIGGMWPAVVAAVAGFIMLNLFFAEPFHTLIIADRENVPALLAFLVVAVPVAAVVDLAARRTRQAAAASAEASILAAVAGSVLRGVDPLTALLERLRETFALGSVTLLERAPGAPTDVRPDTEAAWRIAAWVGDPPSHGRDDADTTVSIDDQILLAVRGQTLAAADRRIVEAFAAQAAVALRQQRLADEAAKARPLAEADKMRTALLAAVSHDLRNPLASAMAAVASLRSPDVAFSDADRDELLATAAESHERLQRLIENLLDMSRLQAGALGLSVTAVWLEDAVPAALDELGEQGHHVRVTIPGGLPTASADPGLLQRILVNVIHNALRFSPPNRPPAVTIADQDDHIQVRVIDHGPGIPDDQRDRIFQPFQRLGDRSNDTGIGLGLALSRGLAEAMGGSLTPGSTPGGGLTMVLTLPASEPVVTAEDAQAMELAERAVLERIHRRDRTLEGDR